MTHVVESQHANLIKGMIEATSCLLRHSRDSTCSQSVAHELNTFILESKNFKLMLTHTSAKGKKEKHFIIIMIPSGVKLI
jgi:hypothetical protein